MIRAARTKDEAMKAFTAGDLIEYEDGSMNFAQIVNLFADLVASGMAWTLQGGYGRAAQDLIDKGYISVDGAVLNDEKVPF